MNANTAPSQAPNILDAIQWNLSCTEFGTIAHSILSYQAEANPVYRRFVQAHQASGGKLERWQDFPALPVSAFRHEPVCCFPPDQAKLVFETSGTTGHQTGRHYLRTASHYEDSLWQGFHHFLPGLEDHVWISLIPSFASRRHSSLSYMIEFLATITTGERARVLCDENYIVDWDFLANVLCDPYLSQPVALFGTSFVWADFLDRYSTLASDGRFHLPEGSLLFDTGGFKKRPVACSREDLWKKLSELLAISPANIWNEYGMTELCSQCYARASDGIHRAPPWLHVRIVNPETGRLCEPGQKGLIEFVDLANAESAAAIATLDVGVYEKNGFRLLGRLSDAPERGCSLPYQP